MALLERDDQLARLAAALGESRRLRGRLVLVTGEAGIGKTTLLAAFCAELPSRTRVLWGSADAVTPARPFAPWADIADRTGGPLRRALAEADRERVFGEVMALLREPGAAPTVVVLDDLHWADGATLDLLRIVGRRANTFPTLVVGAYRDHDVDDEHPLRIALGDLASTRPVEIRLDPLSLGAVERLVAGRRLDPAMLHQATRGNPFFLSEVLAAGDGEVPTGVRDAVLARVARLSPAARQVVRAAAVLGPRCEPDVLLDLAGADESALDETLRRAVLQLDQGEVAFRHDLARRAVLDSLGPSRAGALHRRALALLRRQRMHDAGRLARHAVAGQDPAAILELAPRAGADAAGLGAHREAAAWYRAAVVHAARLDDRGAATLLEQFARECRLAGNSVSALDAQRRALDGWRRVGDLLREGACLTGMSGLLWLAGDPDGADRAATEAVEILEALPSGPELARAYAVLAQRHLLGARDPDAIALSTRALALAERLGEESTVVHAMTTRGVSEIYLGRREGWARVEASITRARGAGLGEEASRALINLVEAARDERRYDLADRYIDESIRWLQDLDLGLYEHLLRVRLAALAAERGRWDIAVDQASDLLDRDGLAPIIRARALTVIGRLIARRGDASPWPALDEAMTTLATEIQDLAYARAARAEAAWLAGDHDRAREEAGLAMGAALEGRLFWLWNELCFWTWRAGGEPPTDAPVDGPATPFRSQIEGRHAEAAAAWEAIGAPYEQAMALADGDDEGDLRRALAIFLELGARPMANRVADRLRAMGAPRIPRGQRTSTRGNPARLTDRELEVLALLVSGRRNSQIADALVLSRRTVDRHVAAILRKLGVADRAAARREAVRLGLNVGDASGQVG